MDDLTEATDDIRGMYDDLYSAVFEKQDDDQLALLNALAESLGAVLYASAPGASPAAVTQERANAIGADLRALRDNLAAGGDADLIALEAQLHQACSQALVDFYPEIDWQQAAGQVGTGKGQAQPQAGVKHEPAPTAAAA